MKEWRLKAGGEQNIMERREAEARRRLRWLQRGEIPNTLCVSGGRCSAAMVRSNAITMGRRLERMHIFQ